MPVTNSFSFLAFFRLSLFFISLSCFAQCGKVIKVKDGDTFVLLLPNQETVTVRVAFVDAPEHSQPFGIQAKEYASTQLLNKQICLDVKYKDPYGRRVAWVRLPNGKAYNEEVIKAGWAWHYVQYSKDPKLASFEKAARSSKKGLWLKCCPTAPWEWRKRHGIGYKHR